MLIEMTLINASTFDISMKAFTRDTDAIDKNFMQHSLEVFLVLYALARYILIIL